MTNTHTPKKITFGHQTVTIDSIIAVRLDIRQEAYRYEVHVSYCKPGSRKTRVAIANFSNRNDAQDAFATVDMAHLDHLQGIKNGAEDDGTPDIFNRSGGFLSADGA